MLVILGCAIFLSGFLALAATYKGSYEAFNLATLGVTISTFQHYPRSPPNSGYLQQPWDYQSRQTSPTSPTGPQDRWRRREGGGVPQEGHPCSRQGDQPHEEAHNKYMSPSPRSADTTPTTAGGRIPHPQPSGGSAESSRPSTASLVRTEPYGGYGGIAPARAVPDLGLGISSRRHSAESNVQTPSRALGVHSILNPAAELEDTSSPDVRFAPQHAMSLSQTLVAAPTESPRSRKRADPRSPPREFEPGSGRMGRRVLTPKSPGLRAASLGTRRNPAFHSTIQPLPPPAGTSSRLYTAEPGQYQTSEIPPLPPLSLATGAHLSGIVPPEAGQPRSAHVQESPVARGAEPASTSQTERSSTVQPPYSNIDRGSPGYRYSVSKPPPAPQAPGPFRAISAGGGGLYIHEAPGHHGLHEGYQQDPASYQITLNTDQGPLNIPVELDLQQASKVADEKRKRNAGASARFRARRKEKEKEASQTIAGLQQELRDLIEERDHYLSERNYFRELAMRYVSGAQLLPRPESPQQRRVAGATTGGPHVSSGLLETPTVSDDSSRERNEPGPSSQRRRTGDYQPSFTGRQTHSPPAPGYATAFSSQPSLPLPPPPVPSMFGASRAFPPGPPPPPPVTRSQSYDPFRRDPFDRSWNSGR
ncbi:hypothetical protein FOPE_01757 [Fonsecaea pedrosoi]|nr:hypothetical protein FOPE_01757 [Fonsecaea pedrosoi]